MTKENLTKEMTDLLEAYLANREAYDTNPQLRVDPENLSVTLVNGSDMLAEIEDSYEALENAAAAHGEAQQEADDFQVTRNPDFYTVSLLLKSDGNGGKTIDSTAVADIASDYFQDS